MAMNALGRHYLVELWEADNLDRPDLVEEALVETVRSTGGTLVDVRTVPFPNGGCSGVAIIAESHISIHTWPEYGYAAVDLFTCSSKMDADAGLETLKKYFSPGRVQVAEVRRGILP
jgi:S-adenosylmethionine decarboxylase